MALATKADVEARLGRSLTSDEAGTDDARVGALLEDASAVVIGYCGTDLESLDDYPTPVVGVVAKMVARLYERGGGGMGLIEQQNAGPFGVRYPTSVSTGDVWLTAADKLALRPYRVGGMSSVHLVGDRYEISE